MDNKEKLKQIFADVFSISIDNIDDKFNNQSVDDWDSIHQLSLTSSLEDTFDIMLDAEDILEVTSFTSAVAILNKYGVTV